MVDAPGATHGLRGQLIRAVKGSVLLRVVSLASTFAGSVVLARALGVHEYGVYSYVFAIVTLLALPSQVGIPTLLVRETARTHAKSDWARMKGVWIWATRVIMLTSVAIAVVAAIVILANGARIDTGLRLTILAGLVLVPLIALGNARGAALRGLRMIVYGQLPESVVRPVLLVAFVGAAWWFHGQLSATEAMAWNVMAAGISFAVGAAILWKFRPAGVAVARADLAASPEWWRAALPLALMAGLQVASNQAGILLLGVFRSHAEVGLFKVATSAATLALFGLQTVNLVLAPHMARLHATGELSRLQRLSSVAALASGAMTVPVFLVFALGGPYLLKLIYGVHYEGAYLPLVIIAAGQVINALFGAVGLLVNMSGLERQGVRCLVYSTTVNVVASFVLIPFFGTLGAAVAAVAGILVWNIGFWRIVKREIGVDGSILAVVRHGLK